MFFTGFIISIFAYIIVCDPAINLEIEQRIKKLLLTKVKYTLIVMLSIGTLLMFVPTKDTAYKMLTVYGAVELSKIEEVKQLSEKSYKVLNKVLDDYLDENEEK